MYLLSTLIASFFTEGPACWISFWRGQLLCKDRLSSHAGNRWSTPPLGIASLDHTLFWLTRSLLPLLLDCKELFRLSIILNTFHRFVFFQLALIFANKGITMHFPKRIKISLEQSFLVFAVLEEQVVTIGAEHLELEIRRGDLRTHQESRLTAFYKQIAALSVSFIVLFCSDS